ncbi:DNA polymerase lambda [Mycena kentingensis (nom. inval.)]|nr:DNA polymerase lambda [Mycena kentingensis (nom. inval.)]
MDEDDIDSMVDAFYLEQDARMYGDIGEPEPRMSTVSFADSPATSMPDVKEGEGMTPPPPQDDLCAVEEPNKREMTVTREQATAPREEAPMAEDEPNDTESTRTFAETRLEDIEMQPPSPPLPVAPLPSSPIASSSPPPQSPRLKRKEPPTQVEEPPKKKPSSKKASPEPQPIAKASPKKLKSLSKVAPMRIKIPDAPVPVAIDISSSPIEEPNFSVLVGASKPEATSTQQPKPLAAKPSEFDLMMRRMAQRNQQKEQKSRRKGKLASMLEVGQSTVDVSEIISVDSSPEPESKKMAGKGKEKAVAPPKPAAAKKTSAKGKKKEPNRSPQEYAQLLLTLAKENPKDPRLRRATNETALLPEYTIFYSGGDLDVVLDGTQRRMEIIVKSGATLAPTYVPETVTHIVCDRGMSEATLCKALGVRNLAQVPLRIPVVHWDWALKGGHCFAYPAFESRIPLIEGSKEPTDTKERVGSPKQYSPAFDDDDDSEAEREKYQAPRKPKKASSKTIVQANQAASRSAAPSALKDDPLAEFHEMAVAERKAGEDLLNSDSEAEEDEVAPESGNPNQLVIDKLEELKELHAAKATDDDRWRVYSYGKVLRVLRSLQTPIRTYEQAMKLEHCNHKTASKIMEIVRTGDLQRIKAENTPETRVKRLFQGIYGVGGSIAQQWYNYGCRTLEDLLMGKGGVQLTEAQKIGLEFYDGAISTRECPARKAAQLFELIKPVALNIDPKLEVHIMGSFRRGKVTCGDIDIMITRDPADGKTHAGILARLLKALHKKGIITEDLALPENPYDEEAIYRGLCRLPDVEGAKRRRIDFLTIPWKCRGAALLYYTGDDIFNRKMRYKANRMGYSLNQKGLFEGVVRNPSKWSEKTNAGNVIASETEEEIFRLLGIPFLLPHERGKHVNVYKK